MALTEFLFNPTTLMELSAVTAAFLLLPRQGYPGAFLYYLLLVLLIEALGFFFRTQLQMPNAYLYNVLNLVQSFFFFWLFIAFTPPSKGKAVLRWLPAFFATWFCIETLARVVTMTVSDHYNKYFRILLAIMVVTMSLRFYFALLREDSIRNPLAESRFWIVTGLFFFYLCSTPISSLEEQVAKIKLSGNLSFYTLVMGCINVVLYGSWIIAFLCLRKEQSSKPSL